MTTVKCLNCGKEYIRSLEGGYKYCTKCSYEVERSYNHTHTKEYMRNYYHTVRKFNEKYKQYEKEYQKQYRLKHKI